MISTICFAIQLKLSLYLDGVSCEKEGSHSFPIETYLQNAQQDGENIGPEGPSSMECIERVASSSNIPGFSVAINQSSTGPECYKVLSGNDHLQPAKARKLTVERDPRKYVCHLFWFFSFRYQSFISM